MPRLLAGGLVNQIFGMQAELRSDKLDDIRGYQLARSQRPNWGPPPRPAASSEQLDRAV